MENEELEMTVMELIVNSGNTKSLAMEAIKAARNNEFDRADELLKEADQAITDAHKVQTKLLTEEANGKAFQFSILLGHSQDHLMNAITTLDLAKEIVLQWKAIYELKEKN